jgi:hypothetical protein
MGRHFSLIRARARPGVPGNPAARRAPALRRRLVLSRLAVTRGGRRAAKSVAFADGADSVSALTTP